MGRAIKVVRQINQKDCGPACLKMLAGYHGKSYDLASLIRLAQTTREGSSLLGLSEAAEKIGFRSLGVKVDLDKLIKESPLPCVLHWNRNHFVVLHKISGKGQNQKFHIADPAHGMLNYNRKDFLANWQQDGSAARPRLHRRKV